MFDQWGELSLLPPVDNGPQLHGGNPIGPSTLLRMVSLPFEGLRTVSLSNRSNHFVPASRGGCYIEYIDFSVTLVADPLRK